MSEFSDGKEDNKVHGVLFFKYIGNAESDKTKKKNEEKKKKVKVKVKKEEEMEKTMLGLDLHGMVGTDSFASSFKCL
jgi:hypothetical protein